jgi:hypothetical protein
MNQLGNALSVAGISLLALNIFSRRIGYFQSSWGVVGLPADAALMFSTILVLVGVLVKLCATPTTQQLFARDLRLFFWIGAISVISPASWVRASIHIERNVQKPTTGTEPDF